MSDIRSGTNEKVPGPAKVLPGRPAVNNSTEDIEILVYLPTFCCKNVIDKTTELYPRGVY